MKKSTKILGGTFVAVVALAFAFTISPAMAYHGDYSKQGPDYSAERHIAITKAFANEDYEAWRESMNGRGRVIQVINAENFSRFAEAHKLAHEGDLEGANQIRKELGLRISNGEKVGAGYGREQGNGNKQGRGR